MRVLINALSVTNLSGRHVLLGHLSRLAKWTQGQHEYVVLYHRTNRNICQELGENITWMECPAYTVNWAGRTWWEQVILPRLFKRKRIDFIFSLSGTIVPSLKLPQVSYAMNPVPLINGLEHNILGYVKTGLQRWGYRKAMEKATMMLFLSEYIRQKYRQNAGFHEKASEIVYPGIDEEVFNVSKRLCKTITKKPYQIITVSVMASHKGIETLVKAVNLVRQSYSIPARLLLVGPWLDSSYEKRIRQLITELKLVNDVEIKGYASRYELNKYYAESRLFCLMSRSESFGIPAVEAQAFGAPVVSSDCCAIPEVCGNGGIYREQNDVQGVAREIASLLTDEGIYKELSEAAHQNAERFHWEICSRPLMHMFDAVANGNM